MGRNSTAYVERGIRGVNFSDLLDYNSLGFLNTGVKAAVLREAFPLVADSTSSVNDWFLYAGLLSKGFKAKFVDGAITHYRQHVANTVG